MKQLILFSFGFLLFFTSCQGTEFYYSMESELIQTKENIVLTNQSLQVNFNISLQDSEDMAVYAHQLLDLKTNALVLHIINSNQSQLVNPILKIGDKEVLLLPDSTSTDFIVDDVSFLKIISEKITTTDEVSIRLISDTSNFSENVAIDVSIALKVKGGFVGGH